MLADIYELFKKEKGTRTKFEDLSGAFYTAIPHRIGRTREAVSAAVIDSLAEISQKQETLQLMKDMLAVNGEKGSVLCDDKVDDKYQALGCTIEQLPNGSPAYNEWEAHVLKSQVKSKNIKVVTIGNRVTLRGPVATEAEKSLIETMALRTTGVGHIDNQLEVTR